MNLSFDWFAALLLQVEGDQRSENEAPGRRRQFFESLQIEDLVLGRACAEGNEAAWDRFLRKYRPVLDGAAMLLCKDEAASRDVVSLLIGDLYGTALDHAGRRRSKLASYAGRGSLAGWLRATLAQTCIDRQRVSRRFVSLGEALPLLTGMRTQESAGPTDVRLGPAVEDLLRELPAESRLLLKAYYLDGMTFAEIGRLMGMHESTVSRRVGKLTTGLRRSLVRLLRKRGMSFAAAKEALGADVRRIAVDVRRTLLQPSEPL
jgi:RNA polymerase sigma-70 factor (ECF subfamily)